MLGQALEYRTSIIKFNIMELKKKVLKETLIWFEDKVTGYNPIKVKIKLFQILFLVSSIDMILAIPRG